MAHKRVAVFADAGYFWVQLSNIILGGYSSRGLVTVNYDSLRTLLLAELDSQFGPDHDLLRVYWYDGPGTNGKTAEHHAIDRLDDFKLRLGTRNGTGTQKGVDGLIIADLISLTQQKAITHAVLLTGDSDVTPGVIAAQGMGLRVHLLSLGPSVATSPYLAAEADLKRSWGAAEAGKFASATPKTNTVPAIQRVASAKALAAQSTPTTPSAITSGQGTAAIPCAAPAGQAKVATPVLAVHSATTPSPAPTAQGTENTQPSGVTSPVTQSAPTSPSVSASQGTVSTRAPVSTRAGSSAATPGNGTPTTYSSLPTVTPASIAQKAFSEFQNGPLAAQLAALAGQKVGNLPREIDAPLLGHGRSMMGRPLNEAEKRKLRNEFRQLL